MSDSFNLVPALLRLIEADLERGDDGRPVVQLMIKIIRYACRSLPVDDPRRAELLIFGHWVPIGLARKGERGVIFGQSIRSHARTRADP